MIILVDNKTPEMMLELKRETRIGWMYAPFGYGLGALYPWYIVRIAYIKVHQLRSLFCLGKQR